MCFFCIKTPVFTIKTQILEFLEFLENSRILEFLEFLDFIKFIKSWSCARAWGHVCCCVLLECMTWEKCCPLAAIIELLPMEQCNHRSVAHWWHSLACVCAWARALVQDPEAQCVGALVQDPLPSRWHPRHQRPGCRTRTRNHSPRAKWMTRVMMNQPSHLL